MAPASAAASAHWPATVEQETKLKGVRRAAEYLFPTADIDQMLREIERGYEG
jgi:hypothetical protein